MFPHRYGKDWAEQIVDRPGKISSGYLPQGVPRIDQVTLTAKVVNDLTEIKREIKTRAHDLHVLRHVAKASS
jgi:hypothetical protein